MQASFFCVCKNKYLIACSFKVWPGNQMLEDDLTDLSENMWPSLTPTCKRREARVLGMVAS